MTRGAVVVNPAAMAKSVGGLRGLFQDAAEIAKQYKKGVIGTALGFEFAMDQNVNLLTTGAHGGYARLHPAPARRARSFNTPGGQPRRRISSAPGRSSPSPGCTASTRKTSRAPAISNRSSSRRTARPTRDGNVTIPIAPSIVLAGPQVVNGTVAASSGERGSGVPDVGRRRVPRIP